VEMIQHLDTRRFCAQGIVSAGAIIPTSIVSFPVEESHRT